MANPIPKHIQGWRLFRAKADVIDDDDSIEDGTQPGVSVGTGVRWEERDEAVREVEIVIVFEAAGVPVFGSSRGVVTAELGLLMPQQDVDGSTPIPVSAAAPITGTGGAIMRFPIRGPANMFVQLSSITVPTGSSATTMKVYWRPAG